MRTAMPFLLIPLTVLMGLNLGCSNKHRAERAAVQISEVIKPSEDAPPPPQRSYDELAAEVASHIERLHLFNVYSLDDNYSVDLFWSIVNGTKAGDRPEIKRLLTEIRECALQMVALASDPLDAPKLKRAKYVLKYAERTLAKFERFEQMDAESR